MIRGAHTTGEKNRSIRGNVDKSKVRAGWFVQRVSTLISFSAPSFILYLCLPLGAALLRVWLLIRVIFITLDEEKAEQTEVSQVIYNKKRWIRSRRGDGIFNSLSSKVSLWECHLRPGSRRKLQWSVSSHGAACDPVWSGAETCPLPPSPLPFSQFLNIQVIEKTEKHRTEQWLQMTPSICYLSTYHIRMKLWKTGLSKDMNCMGI